MIPLRDSRPSYVSPWVTVSLIGICSVVFVFQLTLSTRRSSVISLEPWEKHGVVFYNYEQLGGYSGGVTISPREEFIFKYGVVPGEISSFTDLPPLVSFPVILTLITSTFLHGDPLHLIGNMLFLWIFGDNVEEAMGHVRFVLFYFLCGVGGALLQVLGSLHSGIPMIGASGAIAGVMAAYFLLFPRSRILTLVPIFFFFTFVEIPALLLVGIWFLLQVIRTPSGVAGNVAVLAHVGGFITGVLLTPYFKDKHLDVELFKYFRT